MVVLGSQQFLCWDKHCGRLLLLVFKIQLLKVYCFDLQPCNPSIGGPAKSQLVHEVDALGGEMGKMADRCYLQKRVLNRSKVKVIPCIYLGSVFLFML